jgi:hypothetical protein
VIAAVLVVSSDDAQAGLAVLLVPYVAVPLGTAVWVAQTVLNARKTASPERGEDAVSSLARPSERLAALVIDFVVVGVVLVVLVSPDPGRSDCAWGHALMRTDPAVGDGRTRRAARTASSRACAPR